MLPFYDDFFSLLNEVSDLLETEKTAYRPVASDGSAGGLLDFHEDELPFEIPGIGTNQTEEETPEEPVEELEEEIIEENEEKVEEKAEEKKEKKKTDKQVSLFSF